jgi:hypothetical protein
VEAQGEEGVALDFLPKVFSRHIEKCTVGLEERKR